MKLFKIDFKKKLFKIDFCVFCVKFEYMKKFSILLLGKGNILVTAAKVNYCQTRGILFISSIDRSTFVSSKNL